MLRAFKAGAQCEIALVGFDNIQKKIMGIMNNPSGSPSSAVCSEIRTLHDGAIELVENGCGGAINGGIANCCSASAAATQWS